MKTICSMLFSLCLTAILYYFQSGSIGSTDNTKDLMESAKVLQDFTGAPVHVPSSTGEALSQLEQLKKTAGQNQARNDDDVTPEDRINSLHVPDALKQEMLDKYHREGKLPLASMEDLRSPANAKESKTAKTDDDKDKGEDLGF